MKSSQPPVVVVHAITGAILVDTYPLPHQKVWDPGVWSVAEHARLAMHPDNPTFEAQQPARVGVTQPVNIIYSDFVESLRHELSPTQDRPTPVYAFAYDWRQDNRTTAEGLGAFIDEVIARTNLLRHYQRGCDTVDLIGHSMGGLVVAAYLAQRQKAQRASRVRKVVTLGTPFGGAVDALTKLTSGESELLGNSSHRERETARMMPSLYQLLPWYPGALVDARGSALDIYRASNWQSTVTDSLGEFIRLYTTDPATPTTASGRRKRALGLLQSMLNQAAAFRDLVQGLDPKRALADQGSGKHSAWLVMVGKDRATRWQARLQDAHEGSRYVEFATLDDHTSMAPVRDRARNIERLLLGDTTVPLVSSVPSWADRQSVVCVRHEDFSRFEIRDTMLSSQLGLHAAMPLMNLVHRWVASFLLGRKIGDVWGRALPGQKAWNPPVPGATWLRD